MAIFQMACALQGFLLRGGITIGDIVHDDEVVFGPGLNRAYELESQVARMPRIILDPDLISEFGDLTDIAIEEDGFCFLNPFTLEFIHLTKQMMENKDDEHGSNLDDIGLPSGGGTSKQMPDELPLRSILLYLIAQIRSPMGDREWEKLAWLHDRIAGQLGAPPARSYPCVQL
jgi:hypothetical protein